MEIHLKIIGALLTLLSFVHVIFPKYFDWKKDLASLSLINRQMMIVHTFFIALVVLLVGVLCLTSSSLLVTTELGKKICLGLAFFWGVRLVFQLFVYDSKLWRGKSFETVMHILFTIFWIYMTVIFAYIYLH